MARPRKDETELRSHAVQIRLTEREFEVFSAVAKRDSRTIADWIRLVALREAKASTDPSSG